MPRRRYVPLVGYTGIESDLRYGIRRDGPRPAIQPGGVYDAVDVFLHDPGVARKRGGTYWAGPALTGAQSAMAVVQVQFPGNPQLIAVGDNGHIYKVTSTTTTDLGGSTLTSIVDNPRVRVGGTTLVVFPFGDGTSTPPLRYDGTNAPTTLGGSPPGGRWAEVYKTRLVLAGTEAEPQRLYFSPTPDIESTWDTATSWIDTNYKVTGLAALQSGLLIFSETHTERLIGSSPPPDSDMDLSTVMSVGCTDARSIVVEGGQCYFANASGVFVTNGVAERCLTSIGGIEAYWQSLFTDYDWSTWTIAAGIYGNNYLIISVQDASGTQRDTLMCFLPRTSWIRLSNVNARMWGNSALGQGQVIGGQELYYADRSSQRIVGVSSMWTPSDSYKNDANGNPVTWSLEYKPFTGYGPGLKAYGNGRLTYDMRAGTATTPTIAITGKTGVNADSSFTPAESPLAATTKTDRRRFNLARDSNAMTVRLEQSGASATTELYVLEAEARDYGYYDQTHDGVGGT